MTTIAQVKQAVRPLLQRNSDLALVGRLVIIKPVHHILCGINIGRSLDPLKFVPTWSVLLLSNLHRNFGYLWGAKVRGTTGHWNINDPDLPTAMCEAIEREALPPMRAVKTLDDFIKLASKERFPLKPLDLYPNIRILVDIARGDLVAAKEICKYLKTKEGKAAYFYMQEKYEHVVQDFCPLVSANDRLGLAKLLRNYEAQSVRNLKIQKFWEPTAFPIE